MNLFKRRFSLVHIKVIHTKEHFTCYNGLHWHQFKLDDQLKSNPDTNVIYAPKIDTVVDIMFNRILTVSDHWHGSTTVVCSDFHGDRAEARSVGTSWILAYVKVNKYNSNNSYHAF